jgi:NADPH:quinone reductase
LGADLAIPYDTSEWPQEVLRHTDGQGVDIILESIGGNVFEQNFECLAPFGRYVILGSTRGPGEPLAPRRLMAKTQSLSGIYVPLFYHHRPQMIGESLRFLANGVQSGTIKASVATMLPLSRTAEAHRMLEGRRAQGIIVLDPRNWRVTLVQTRHPRTIPFPSCSCCRRRRETLRPWRSHRAYRPCRAEHCWKKAS